MKTFSSIRFIPIAIFSIALIFLTTCDREERNNPWDPHNTLTPDAWAPKGVSFSINSINSISLSWESQITHFEGFKIDRKQGDEEWTISFAILEKDEDSFTDTDVSLNIPYFYRVYSYAGENNSSFAEVVTDPFTLPTVTTSAVDYLTSNSIDVCGNITSNGGKPITDRGLCWSTSENPTIENNYTSNGQGDGEFKTTITGLTTNTTYYIRTYASNIGGISYGNQITTKTLEENRVMDKDGNIYKTVIINGVEWMAENLRVTRYSDGTEISTGLNDTQWQSTSSGAYAVYPAESIDGIETNNDVLEAYGALYNWYSISNQRNICPVGWRVPTDHDWSELTNYVVTVNDIDIGNQLKSCRQVDSPSGGECSTYEHPRWESHSTHFGTNSFEFSALPGGIRYNNGSFLGIGTQANFWSASSQNVDYAFYMGFYNNNGNVSRSIEHKNMGYSVRCLKDSSQ